MVCHSCLPLPALPLLNSSLLAVAMSLLSPYSQRINTILYLLLFCPASLWTLYHVAAADFDHLVSYPCVRLHQP